MNSIRTGLLIGALALGVASNASAATISCPTPDPVPDDGTGPNQDATDSRFFVLTIASGTAICFAEGNGNLQEVDFPSLLDGDVGAQVPGAEGVLAYSLIAPNDNGTFTIDPSVWSGPTPWASVLLGFKSGGGGETPEWAVFQLSGGVLGGSWDINDDEADQGLSHAILWGRERGTPPPAAVPEPASLLLMGSGLAAAGSRLRRRKTT
jgi:hypothetical protein